MTLGPDTGFAARCRALCPSFEPTETLPARKSELLAGEVDGTRVVAKRLSRPDDVWAWYLAREIAIYRAFAAQPPPVRVPALIAADSSSGLDDVLIIERLPGAPVGARRSPQTILDENVVRELIAMHDRFMTWTGATPHELPPPAVKSQLRTRFLEDPTAGVGWVTDGVSRAAHRNLIGATVATQIVSSIEAHPATAPSHGDLLLRNAVGDGTLVGLVDWECAGPHLADWDLALLWTQLHVSQRRLVEDVVTGHERQRAFLGLVAFALVREIAILLAFRRGPQDAEFSRFSLELDEVCGRIVGE